MKKNRKLGAILLIAVITLFLASCFVDFAKANFTVNRTFTSSNSDGYIYTIRVTYSEAYSATAGTVSASEVSFVVGQRIVGGVSYRIYRGFMFFDTSIIPSTATITSANLSLYVSSDSSTTDFNVTVQTGMPIYPHDPLVAGDYYQGWYSGDGGSRNTSAITDVGYWNVTLNATGLAWINKGGATKFCLRSSRDISIISPTGDEYVIFYSREMGEAYAPKLYVTYTMGDGGEGEGGGPVNYLVHGPYYEDGSVADSLVTVVMTQPYNSSLTFNLDGTDDVADTKNITVDQPASYLSWNISSSQDYTRIYYFLNATFDEVWIFMPKPSEPIYGYQFGITDFYGMQNPYLEAVINVNGTSRVVERKKLDVATTITFFMIQWHRYDLRFRCDQGVYTLAFSAEGTFLINIPVLAGAFPTTAYAYPTVTATRTSGSVITIAYADPTESTFWVYFQIYHYVGQTGIEDYSLNTTGNSYSFPWSEADNATSYYVHIQAYANNKLWNWLVPALVSSYGVNPWTGIIAPSFGSLPLINVDFSQIIAAAIILCVLGIFSYSSAGVGCILSLIAAGIFVVMGWYIMSLPMFLFSGFVGVFVMIEEAKRTEREI